MRRAFVIGEIIKPEGSEGIELFSLNPFFPGTHISSLPHHEESSTASPGA
jgi:hypothetical protein